MPYPPEFKEIAHCGGKVNVTVVTKDGRRGVSFGVEHARPVPASWFAVYALPPHGVAVAMIELGGIGQPWNPPPCPDCIPVFIGSDSHGLFSHQCPKCNGYWRSNMVPALWNITCPYCGVSAETHHFLTPGQRRFMKAVCELTVKAIHAEADGKHVIDMDQIADDVENKTGERPSFYYAEESQQNHYTCAACGFTDDIIDRYGYCSSCGTRNDLQELARDIEAVNAKTRERVNPRCAEQSLYSAHPGSPQFCRRRTWGQPGRQSACLPMTQRKRA
jgi:hypothetical protein